MAKVDWAAIPHTDFRVPDVAPLSDLTAELTELLGHPDPRLREDVAVPVLSTWIARGVYDDLLTGLGDGIATGLSRGLGERDTDSVFRRSSCAVVLTDCIVRDIRQSLVPKDRAVDWVDRLATWLLAERDLRGHVPGKGWAKAVARGATALGAFAASPHCGRPELTVLLDVLGERVTTPVDAVWSAGEADQVAAATVQLLRRDLIPLEQVEEWATRIGARALGADDERHEPDPTALNADAFLRALYLQLALGPEPPATRADLVLTLVLLLRELHPELLGRPR
ncbi:DUF2785 domain-containing protein [Nocardioides sp. SYSU DS0651]|uniref:DUF2785 domain-containing protein n=1 Tax=Nocardioides sp. SYSU DS0651 TaxID=3415955 RepID=UPI003F4B864C